MLTSSLKPTAAPKWYAKIGGQSNRGMANKAFWLRAAAHYRDPFWRDVKAEMHALRMVRKANQYLRTYCLNVTY